MREYHDRDAALQVLYVVFQPFQLIVTQRPQPPGFQIHHVYQPDEVRTLLLETVPTSALAALSITLKELFSVVVQHVVLSRHIEDIFGLRAFQNLVDRIEFLRL